MRLQPILRAVREAGERQVDDGKRARELRAMEARKKHAPEIKTGALYSRKHNAPRVRRTPTHTIQSQEYAVLHMSTIRWS